MKYLAPKNHRLVYVEQKATPEFWDALWETKNLAKTIASPDGSRFVVWITKKFFTPNKRIAILDGGCGKGQYVYGLERAGFNAYGVDYARETVSAVNKAIPALQVSYGDVRQLDFKDDYFDAYWSLGVIEHFYEGYEEVLKEAHRVIRKKGYLFITCPHMSLLRKIKARFGAYPLLDEKNFDKSHFYQFALDSAVVVRTVEKHGFQLVRKQCFDGIKGLKDELGNSLVKDLVQKIYCSKNYFLRLLRMACYFALAPVCGHIILLVFKKNDVGNK